MIIKTKYGSVDLADLDKESLSEESQEFLDQITEASGLFFSEEIDLTDPTDMDSEEAIQELIEVAILHNKFDNPERAFALAEHLGEDLTDIEQSKYNPNQFEVGRAEYLVLTDEEAETEAVESAKNLLDDIGIEGLSEDAQSYIMDNFVDTEWFNDAMHEYNDSYAGDIKDESASEPYLHRLHEEMVERGIMSEPEWPEEDDYQDDDGELDEDAYEEAKSEYEEELESEIEDNLEAFVEALDSDYDDGVDYWKQNFGDESTTKTIIDQQLANLDEVAEWLVSQDGRGAQLAGYDNNEEEISMTYKREDYTFYIYRTN